MEDKTMKTKIYLLSVFVLVLIFVSCNNSNPPYTEGEDLPSEQVVLIKMTPELQEHVFVSPIVDSVIITDINSYYCYKLFYGDGLVLCNPNKADSIYADFIQSQFKLLGTSPYILLEGGFAIIDWKWRNFHPLFGAWRGIRAHDAHIVEYRYDYVTLYTTNANYANGAIANEEYYLLPIHWNEIKDLKVKLERDRDRGADFYMSKTSTNFFNPSVRQTKTSYFDSNAFQKKISSEPSTGTDDIFYKTASNIKDRKSLENEVLSLRQKLEEKNNNKKTANNKIYNQGNLVMTSRTIDEIKKLKKKVDNLYKEYEDRVRNSIDNNLGNIEYKNKVISDSLKIFFSSVKKAINDIDTKISNWQFILKMNLGGMKYAKK